MNKGYYVVKSTGSSHKPFALLFLFLAVLGLASTSALATVAVSPLFGNNMVIQRDKPFPVWGTAATNKTITVTYNGQTASAVSDAQGNWQVTLPAMGVNATGSNLTIAEAGGNTLTLANVVVGDVWLCSGQSNMAFSMGSLTSAQSDITNANYPGLRNFAVAQASAGNPTKNLGGSWSVCTPSTVTGFSAVGFYFGRRLYLNQNTNIPIGLIVSSVGGTRIDPWVGPEGYTDIPVLAPLYSQPTLPTGPSSLFNGMIYPLAPFPMKGAIWYQGENGEATTQSADSYFLKEKALQQGWRRLQGQDDFAYYVVLLANYGTPNTNTAPDMVSPGTWADTRIQQLNALGLPHAGAASAIDVGDPNNLHPQDKYDVGERLARWALHNDYGQTSLVPAGPVLRDVVVSNSTLICSFDYVGAGLMVGYKTTNSQPTVEVVGGVLTNFSIAGATGSWYAATVTINSNNNTLTLSSPSVPSPAKVAYACWQSPAGLNFYNRDGLPANPFYVDDVTAKYTVTASAGTGGSISPVGASTYLKRKTALYTITPNTGNYIQDVKVDGVSVGAVESYTFDPLYTNHTITATFTNTQPVYTLSATAGAGGSLSPAGAITVAQGGSQTFSITPNPGNLVSVLVDGKPMGQRGLFTFGDVRAAHSLAVSFSCPINAQAGYGGNISPSGSTVVTYSSNQTYTITALTNFTVAKVTVDGTNVGALTSYTFTNVTGPHTITASFAGGTGTGSVPQQSQIIFSCLTDPLPTNGPISSWSTFIPSGQSLTPMASPTAEVIDGRTFAHDSVLDGDGFRYGSSYSSPIPCSGASIVVVGKPTRYGTDGNWQSLVDVFYDRLVLGIMNGTGRVCVRCNGSATQYSSATIPEGQTTILSIVVQTNGTYKVFANGTPVLTNTTLSDMTALVPGVTGGAGGFGSYINVGRNNSDNWSTFNGDVGDVFLYKTALSDTERVQLETYIANRLSGSVTNTYQISASAGANGTVNPSGSVVVNAGANQTFTIAANSGYIISDVTVDGASVGAVSSYTFTNVNANHTLAASFTAYTPPTPVAWYQLETNVVDTMGNFNGTAYNNPTYVTGKLGSYAIQFNGSSQYVSISRPVSNDWTIAFWVKTTQTSLTGSQWWQGNGLVDGECAGATTDFGVSFLNNKVAFGVGNPDTTFQSVSTINSGTWTHVACTRNNSTGQMKVYINGVLETTGTGPTGTRVAPPALHFGNLQTTLNYFNGALDQIKIYTNVLSATDISYLANEVNSYTITATAGANGSISPSGSVVVSAGGNQSFSITPNSGYGISSVVVDGVSQGAVTSYTFTNVTAGHTISASFAASGPSPIAWYQFETNVLDSAGTNNGTAYNNPSYIAGKIGSYAIQFNGTNQYATLPRCISNDFTIAFWVKTTQISRTGSQWYNGNGLVDGEVAGVANDFGVSFLNNKVAFGVGNPDTTFQSTNTINSGNWTHVAVTRNSTNGQMNIYINGVLETTGTGPTGTRAAPPSLHLGDLQTGLYYFNGALDQLKIYNTVLSASDISALASESSGAAPMLALSSLAPAGSQSTSSSPVSTTPVASLPGPWLNEDLGDVGAAGSASYGEGTYTLAGGGAAIGGTADTCQFVYQPSSGDCTNIVRVATIQNTGTAARAGVMIRDNLNANAMAAGLWVSPSGISFTYRTSTGGSTGTKTAHNKTAPYWLMLTRSGNAFSAYYSADGTTWKQLGATQTISMAPNAYLGMGVCSGVTGALCTATLDNVTAAP